MTAVGKTLFAALIVVALQTNQVQAFTIDMKLASDSESEAWRLAASFGSGEASRQAAKVMLGELSSAEASTRKEAMQMTEAKALEVISKHHNTSAVVNTLVRQKFGQKAPGYEGVQKGQDMLNDMIKEAQEKLDLERQTCWTFIKVQTHQIWLTVQDIRMYDAAAAGAREDVLAAQTEIERLTQLLPKLTESLEAHNMKCEVDIADLEAQLKIVLGDIEVMGNILKLTECKESLLMIHATRVKSTEAKQLLQEGVDSACEEDSEDEIVEKENSLSNAPNPDDDDDAGEVLLQVSANPTKAEPKKQRAKCTLSKKSCKRLRDKFLMIQSGIESKKEELLAELNAIRKHCIDEKANLESQISDAETDLKSWQTALAKATKEQNDAERNSKIKNEERVALIKELVRMTKLCKVNINNLVSEGCALGKIRGELEKMKGHTNPAFLQDCEVTDWSSEECSVSCAGGMQKLTRAVSVHPVGGAACPPLEMTRTCNEDACPVDCEVGDWSEWGDCSSECNGGVKQKIRNVVKTAENGGAACGDTSVADSCNIQSCDEDCILSDWTGFSVCSKDCGGGLRTRVKNVAESEKGDGDCAARDADSRLEFMPCNAQDCKSAVVCQSKLDVVLLLDGSGSLGTTGWKQTVKFGQMFTKALHGGEDNVKLSVILFSGPRTWEMARRCTSGSGQAPALKDCGIQIVQHFTTDMKKASGIIKDLEWPAASTLTSQALMTAKSELSLGRKDASSVVVVVTDGRPMSRPRTAKASLDLRKGARLMWVPVTTFVPIKDVREWASKPVSENIIQLKDFYTMTDPESINAIVSNMCPIVNQTDCWSTFKCPSGMNKVGDGTSCADSTGDKTCDLGYCDGRPNVGMESCSTGPIAKEELVGNNLGHKCWNRFPCPEKMSRSEGDGSFCDDGKGKKCDLGYCNNSPNNADMEMCETGPDKITTTNSP